MTHNGGRALPVSSEAALAPERRRGGPGVRLPLSPCPAKG